MSCGRTVLGADHRYRARSELAKSSASQTLVCQLIGAFILLGLASVSLGQTHINPTPLVWKSLIFQTVMVSVVSFLMWFWLLRTYLASQLGVFSFMTPFFGVLFGVLFLAEPLELTFFIGAICVLSGICLVSGYGWINQIIASRRHASVTAYKYPQQLPPGDTMQAHIVIAHPETQSFNHHLARVARNELEQQGWSVSVSDLYQMDFDPCERFSHYHNPMDRDRFNIQGEQRYACENGAIPSEVKEEIERLDAADLLILQYPMWWHLPPAMLKGWFDRVFIYGEVYTSRKRFENGRCKGKQAMLTVTVGTSRETYAYNGRSGDIDLLLWPIHFNLAYVGFTVLEPFVAYGVEAGIQYSDKKITEQRLQAIPEQLNARLRSRESSKVIPFNKMSDWSEKGTIKESAHTYSPFIRHKQDPG